MDYSFHMSILYSLCFLISLQFSHTLHLFIIDSGTPMGLKVLDFCCPCLPLLTLTHIGLCGCVLSSSFVILKLFFPSSLHILNALLRRGTVFAFSESHGALLTWNIFIFIIHPEASISPSIRMRFQYALYYLQYVFQHFALRQPCLFMYLLLLSLFSDHFFSIL